MTGPDLGEPGTGLGEVHVPLSRRRHREGFNKETGTEEAKEGVPEFSCLVVISAHVISHDDVTDLERQLSIVATSLSCAPFLKISPHLC